MYVFIDIVPQGSVRGQLMFFLYTNDISQSIDEAFINTFADDASLYTMGTHFKQVNDNVQNNFKNVHGWYANDTLAVNVCVRENIHGWSYVDSEMQVKIIGIWHPQSIVFYV